MSKAVPLRALAVTTKERLPALPDLPTVAETLPGYEAYTWNAILAPAGTAPEIIAAMNMMTNTALSNPALTQRFDELGIASRKKLHSRGNGCLRRRRNGEVATAAAQRWHCAELRCFHARQAASQ